MMWGIAGGIPAGVAGGIVARAVCMPTGVLIGWIAGVARWSSSAPLGRLGAVHIVVLGSLVLGGALVRTRRGRLALVACAAAVLLQPTIALATNRQPWHVTPAAGTDLYRWDGATVLVVGAARPDQLLRAVHAAGVGTIDLLVVTRQSPMTSAAIDSLVARIRARSVVGADAGEVDVGSIAVRVTPAGVAATHR